MPYIVLENGFRPHSTLQNRFAPTSISNLNIYLIMRDMQHKSPHVKNSTFHGAIGYLWVVDKSS